MPIKAKVGGSIVEIVEVIIRQGGILIRKSPLKVKIGSIIVDFITYGYSTIAILNLSPIGFDSATLTTTINSLGGLVDNIVVNFQAGTFLCNTPIEITVSNVTLKGTNLTTLKCNSIFTAKGILNFNGALNTELENIVVKGLTLDGDYLTSGHDSYGVMCNYVGKSTINTVVTYDATKVGSNVLSKKGITIKDCVIKNVCQHNIYLQATSNSCFSENVIQNARDSGIVTLSLCSNNSIANNVIQNNDGYPITLNNDYGNTIMGNLIQNNGKQVMLSSSHNNIFSGNTVQNNYGSIQLISSNNNTIVGNTFQNNTATGIALNTSSYNVVSGNTVQYNSAYGIALASASTYNTVTGNTVQSNGGNGILIDASNNNLILSNEININASTNTDTGTGNKKYFNITF